MSAFRRICAIAIWIALGSVAPMVHAEALQFDAIACISEDALNEATRYAIRSDMDGVIQLVRAGQCTVLAKGTKVSVISAGFLKTTIRLEGRKLFVVAEAVGRR